MILVDTSVWIDFLRTGSPALEKLLNQNRVAMHPLVFGELACGNLSNRIQLFRLWRSLTFFPSVNHDEALYFIEKNKLMGKGIGYIDAQLLASVMLAAGGRLWTRDKRLANAASQLDVAWLNVGSNVD